MVSQIIKSVDASHNSCFTVTNRPWYLLVACKQIVKGDFIEAHYGPYSAIILHTYVEAKFMC